MSNVPNVPPKHHPSNQSLAEGFFNVEKKAQLTQLNLNPEQKTVELSLDELKHYRREQMIQQVRAELKKILEFVNQCNEKIKTAKTGYKKTFYQKKIKKASAQVPQMLSFLQQLETMEDEAHKKETSNESPTNPEAHPVEQTADVMA